MADNKGVDKSLFESILNLTLPKEGEAASNDANHFVMDNNILRDVFKAFYHPDLKLEEMNHINFDWFAPANAQRQSIDEVRKWCREAGLDVEREQVEDAGITIVARKQ